MDQSRGPSMEGAGASIKKRRSQTSRRPRPEGQPLSDQSPLSVAPGSDDMGKVSSDENIGDGNSGGKMFNLSRCVSRSLPVGGSNGAASNGTCNGAGSENRPKKVKLKVGGVTRTLQTKSSSNGESGSGSTAKASHSSDNARPRQRLNPQESSDEYHSPPLNKKATLKGVPWKDFSKSSFTFGREDMGKTSAKNSNEKHGDKSDAVRKSRRVPKKRVLDGDFDEDDDDEIRYLEKLKTSRLSGYKDLEAQSTRKLQKGVKNENTEDAARRDSRKPRSGDTDYEEEDELSSDGHAEGKKKKKQKRDLTELPSENKREIALTTRQRALLSKDAPEVGASQIEFPNGLPPAAPRKQKEKLTEVEQQLKKVEAAQRRRLQNEKAARESEAEAIRKILGQDSSRKKREEKIKKRQEELAQGKATNAQMLTSNTIRTVMGPTGTTVTFPQDLGLPKIFESKPYSYPPPREKCAGPSCTNAYKYRDSKSKLPLCSLECYKAVNEDMHTEEAC
ncbi:hypothetical protein SASPL_104289 [Salvia splendens]|uniref:INO80 complex subunit B-like conserved region domain-containing protein n=1 Tax=Salvia splendens TaxID=180675 RepID=A0A8X9AAI4_SALSN|nr:uncharacterized protein LOC121786765 isoform X2 [Salvia splendens]KAG6432704.1 hypothetical protein SASPL_104289 [Salvia splendens]